MNQSVALIVNGKSRRGRDWFKQVEAKLREADCDLVVSYLAQDPKQVGPKVKQAIQDRIPLVCVGGGDGTFSAIAGHFVGSESTLGVLPLGTGNSLARDLGIVADVDTACRAILEGESHAIDLGMVNGQHFVNVATIGITTRIAEGLTDSAKKQFGRAVYLFAIFKAVAKAKRFQVRIELPDGVRKYRSMQVVVANGRYHGGPFPVTPDAEITSGKLAGYSVNTATKGVLLRYALRLWGGRHVDMPEVEAFEATSLNITASPNKKITVDGEINERTPASFKVIPQAIRVMKPR